MRRGGGGALHTQQHMNEYEEETESAMGEQHKT